MAWAESMQPCVLSVFGINPYRIGGVEIFAREFSRQLAHLGWKSVLCFSSNPPENVAAYLELPNVTIESIAQVHRATFSTARRLTALMIKHRPRIAHFQYTPFIGPYPWLARICGARQVFFTDEASRPEGYLPQPAAKWKRTVCRAMNYPLTGVVCGSDYGWRCLHALQVLPPSVYRRIYNSTDVRLAKCCDKRAERFRRAYSIPRERRIVVQIGMLIQEKGVDDLLTAAQLVLQRNRDVHFVLVGGGSARSEYEQRIALAGMSDRITFTGVIHDPMNAGVYDAADLTCQVSRWEELFGYVIAEAMAFARPVIGTRVGGIPEVIDDGITGFLVNRGDPNAIADRILRLLNDEPLRKRLGTAGRKKAEARFDVTKCVAELISWYGISPPSTTA